MRSRRASRALALLLPLLPRGGAAADSCVQCDGLSVRHGAFASTLGSNANAYGIAAIAAGYTTEAAGHYAFAGGHLSAAFGNSSFAYGYGSLARLPPAGHQLVPELASHVVQPKGRGRGVAGRTTSLNI